MIKIENKDNKLTVQVDADEEALHKLAAELEVGMYTVAMIWLKNGIDINTIQKWLYTAYTKANEKLMEGGGVLH